MRGEQQQGPVIRIDPQIIDQDTYRHAAFGGTQETLSGQGADIVGTPDKILHVDGVFSVLDEPGATQQRLSAFFENIGAL